MPSTTRSLLQGEALALAASYAELLRDAHVEEISVRVSRSVLEPSAFPWLEIAIPAGTRLERVVQLRSFVEVLRALAQCAGCAPHRNAQLWEALLFAAGVDLGGPSATSPRFDRAFPRVRLRFAPIVTLVDADPLERPCETEYIDTVLRGFVGLGQKYHEMERNEAMARLAPLVTKTTRRDTPIEPLQLALALPSMDTQYLLPAVATFTEDLRTAKVAMQVVEVSLDNQRRFRSDDPLDGVRWLTELPLVARMAQWTLDDEIEDQSVYARLYRTLLGLDDGNDSCAPATKMEIRSLEVELPNVGEHQFAALCSALPFTQRVYRLHVRKDVDWQWDVLSSEMAWAWLGFAVFHERTAASTWRELTIDGCAFREQDVRALGAMQRDGIVALRSVLEMSDGDDAVDDLLPVRVQSGASVWASAAPDSPFEPVLVLDDTTSFDLVGSLSGGFQAVVVPGVGVGYVREQDTVSASTAFGGMREMSFYGECRTQDPPLRCASLVAFRARSIESTSSATDGLLYSIRALASSLTTLELATEWPLPSRDVNELLASCPNLRSIAIDHDGACWRRWEATRMDVYPSVTSIRLTCSWMEAFSTMLSLQNLPHPGFPALRTLCFHVTKGCAAFPQFARAVGVMLEAQSAIESFAMVKVRRAPATHSSRRSGAPSERRIKLAARLGLPAKYLEVPSQRSAVQYEKTVRLAMQPLSLPSEITRSILAFAGGGRKRHVCIDLV